MRCDVHAWSNTRPIMDLSRVVQLGSSWIMFGVVKTTGMVQYFCGSIFHSLSSISQSSQIWWLKRGVFYPVSAWFAKRLNWYLKINYPLINERSRRLSRSSITCNNAKAFAEKRYFGGLLHLLSCVFMWCYVFHSGLVNCRKKQVGPARCHDRRAD